MTVTVTCSKCNKSDSKTVRVGVKPESRYITLNVYSDYGNPSPSYGAHKHPEGSDITASVNSLVIGGSGIQYICTGFTGGGSVPAKGNGSSIHFTATHESTLQWNWKTQYYLTATASTGGKVIPVSGWHNNDTTVSLTAIADSGYVFSGWNGVDKTNPATIKMDGAKEVVANFKLSEQPQFKVPWSGEGKITQGNNCSEEIPFEVEAAVVEVVNSGNISGCVVLEPGRVNYAGIRIDVAGTSLGTYTDSAGCK
ncbi:MAG: hypothetical protein QME49_07005 [bacterium]|nr:hypothetical protein [bacterium]